MQENQYKHILVLDRSGIGDLVMMIPLLRAVKAALPESVIRAVVDGSQFPIAKSLEDKIVDEVVPVKTRPSIAQKIAIASYLTKIVRENPPDTLIVSAGGYLNSFASMISGAPVRVNPFSGYDRPFTNFAFTHNISHPFFMHCVDRNFLILKYLGLRGSEINFDFVVPEGIVQDAGMIAERNGIGDGSAVAINYTSGQPEKNWPMGNMLPTISALSHDLGYKVVVFGKDAAAPITDGNIVDLRGKTSLLIDAYLQRYSGLFDIVIGVDTGMMHIAGSVNSNSNGSYEDVSGNRTISLFGPTDPRRYAPYDPTHKFNVIVQPDISSMSVNRVGHLEGKGAARIMERITPEMVLEKVEYVRSLRAA